MGGGTGQEGGNPEEEQGKRKKNPKEELMIF